MNSLAATLQKMSKLNLQAAFTASHASLSMPGSPNLTKTRRTYWTAVQAEIRARVSAGQW